jgi:PTH1 family peptidyl-tRNA hydrolase
VSITLIVGLGNPGPQYVATRHNAGFWLVDNLAVQANEQFHAKTKFHGEVCRAEISLPLFPQEHSLPQNKAKAPEHSEPQNFLQKLGFFSAQKSEPLSQSGKVLCWLLKPNTFMNRSGQAVAALANYYQIQPQHILFIHDDLDFPPGTVRLKQGGGDGRHNGLKSIIAQLGSKQFLRLRVGIGHPGRSEEVTNYVLNAPSRDEQIAIEIAIDAVLKVMPLIVAGEVSKAMQYLHTHT